MNESNFFIDIAAKQQNCKHERICGDTFLFRRSDGGNRSIVVLSDGMGHGVKANILSTITASVIANFDYKQESIRKLAATILHSLPKCSIRKISYSTFTIVDIDLKQQRATIIEYDNPRSILLRGAVNLQGTDESTIVVDEGERPQKITVTNFRIEEGDRIVLMSDGVTQSGVGTDAYPFGWGWKNVNQFALETVGNNPAISSEELASAVLVRATGNDREVTNDDVTCGVITIRRPKSVLLCSCPPSSDDLNRELIERLEEFDGKKIICGYHLAQLISYNHGNKIEKRVISHDPDLQPSWDMEGVDIVTESLVTLNKVYDLLSAGDLHRLKAGAAYRVASMLLESDEINLLVGLRRGNGGLYMVDEFELRRKVLRHIAELLERRYRKEVNISYL